MILNKKYKKIKIFTTFILVIWAFTAPFLTGNDFEVCVKHHNHENNVLIEKTNYADNGFFSNFSQHNHCGECIKVDISSKSNLKKNKYFSSYLRFKDRLFFYKNVNYSKFFININFLFQSLKVNVLKIVFLN